MATHNGVKIETACICPPVPSRDFDWVAVTENFDLGHPQGFGASEQAAIDDLISQLEE